MYIARILYPIHVLGPGKRIGIWFDGCPHGCEGCSNPELWQQQPRYQTTAKTLMDLVMRICQSHPVDGFTLTGGDPFYQPEALEALLPRLREISRDILVYTGYEYADLQHTHPQLLAQVGVLIDGKYIWQQNRGLPLRGSDNQQILILDEGLRETYEAYLATAENAVENFTAVDGVISVGIHKPGYEARVDALLKEKGLNK